jgi:hypothetical protein
MTSSRWLMIDAMYPSGDGIVQCTNEAYYDEYCRVATALLKERARWRRRGVHSRALDW